MSWPLTHAVRRKHAQTYGVCACGAKFRQRSSRIRCTRCQHTQNTLRRALRDARRRPTAMLAPLGPPLCGCGLPLKYGSDPVDGRSIQWCARCGESALPLYGTRVQDQRATLDEEIRGTVERAKREPLETSGGYRSGQVWRQRSNEYLTRTKPEAA